MRNVAYITLVTTLLLSLTGCNQAENQLNKQPEQSEIAICIRCGVEDNVYDMWTTADGVECNECSNKCINCGEKLQELHADNYYCVNKDCVSYTDPSEINN